MLGCVTIRRKATSTMVRIVRPKRPEEYVGVEQDHGAGRALRWSSARSAAATASSSVENPGANPPAAEETGMRSRRRRVMLIPSVAARRGPPGRASRSRPGQDSPAEAEEGAAAVFLRHLHQSTPAKRRLRPSPSQPTSGP
jgi:hypothetical protein